MFIILKFYKGKTFWGTILVDVFPFDKSNQIMVLQKCLIHFEELPLYFPLINQNKLYLCNNDLN